MMVRFFVFMWLFQKNRPVLLPALFFLFVSIIGVSATAYEAGASKVDITPPLGVPLNGYLDRWGRGALQQHDPIWARCLYINDGTTGVFWVAADLCVINRELRDRILELLPEELKSMPVILSATHNHSGQGGMIKHILFRTVSGRYMPEVLEQTASGIVQAIQNAYAARKRAVIGYTTFVQTDLSTNRRFPNGPTDTQVGVIRVEDPDGGPIVILANFAAHPTSIGGDDLFTISADYPGFYYTELEQLAGNSCVAMFTNGAEGNQTCTNPTNASGWERTAAVGKILAQRVFEAAKKITCKEMPLRYAVSEPQLPPVIAEAFFPKQTSLQVLEIGDLVLTFFPGEPCVEIGLEMRRQALQRGYAAQFTVGVSNDYLLYFVPRALYPKMIYESGMNFYGPGIEDWFYREFGNLLSRGASAPAPGEFVPPAKETLEGGTYVAFAGTPQEIGRQRGSVFQDEIQRAYKELVVQPCADGRLIPDTGLWRLAPPFLDLTPSALIRLAIGVRPLLDNISPETFAELEATAEACHLPFDAVWLLQCLPQLTAAGYKEELYRSPFCTLFAVTGEKAGADGILVGRTFDAGNAHALTVNTVVPQTGRAFMIISYPWSLGGFSGMNNAGVVVSVESAPELGRPALEDTPVELVVREILERAGTLEDAASLLLEKNTIHGYRFLLAAPPQTGNNKSPASAKETARIVSCGLAPEIRLPQDGLLLGGDTSPETQDLEARSRYERAEVLLKNERILSPDEIREILLDSEGPPEGRVRICNSDTRYVVVFEPKSLRVSVSLRRDEGTMSDYKTFTLEKGKP